MPLVAIVENSLVLVNRAPFTDAQHFPQFDIAEIFEEHQRAQGIKFFGIDSFFLRQLFIAEKPHKVTRKFIPGRIALRDILVHRAHYDLVQRRRNFRAESAGRRRLDIHDLVNHAVVVARIKRQLSGQQPVHGHRQRIDVRLMSERLLPDLLRRHIGRRTHAAYLCRLLAFNQCRTEIGNLDVVVAADHDIGRLDIPVYHALILRIFQRLAALVDDF